MTRQFEPFSQVAESWAGAEIHLVGAAATECTAFFQAVRAHRSDVRFVLHDFAPDADALRTQFQSTHVAHSKEERAALLDDLVRQDIRFRDRYLLGIEGAEWVFAPQSWDLYPQNEPLGTWIGANPGRYLSLMDLYLRCLPCSVVGITGTNGKTTVTSLLAHLIEACGRSVVVGGNHRYHQQLLPKIDSVDPDAVAVLEISHKHLTRLERGPDVAIVTNVVGDHLDELGIDDYIARKRVLAEVLRPGDSLVLPADDPVASSFARVTQATVLPVWIRTAPSGADGGWRAADGQLHVQLAQTHAQWQPADLKLAGLHGASNALCALVALAVLFRGRSDSDWVGRAEGGLRAFRGVKHRIEYLRSIDGIGVYDDTAATSPAATCAALQALSEGGGRPVVVVGGRDKNNDYSDLARAICERAAGVVYMPGTAAEAIETLVTQRNDGPASAREPDLASALGRALALAAGAGDAACVVVSPAGAGVHTTSTKAGGGLRGLVRRWGRPARTRGNSSTEEA